MTADIKEVAVVAICAFVAGLFGLWNTIIEMDVLDLVNTRRPPDKQYPLFGRNYPYFQLREDYKRFFPNGTLLRKADRVKLVAATIFFGGIIVQFLLNRLSK